MGDEIRKDEDELTEEELRKSSGGKQVSHSSRPPMRRRVIEPEGGPVYTTMALGEEGQDGGGVLE